MSHASRTHAMDPVPLVLFGVPFHNVSYADAVAWAESHMASRRPGYIVTPNLDIIMQAWRDPELQRILIEADLVIADGMPVVWLSALFGPRLRERVAGSDLTPMLARAVRDRDGRVFLLGAAPGVAERAAAALQGQLPGLTIAGWHSPPRAELLEMDHSRILQQIRETRPDLLLVAFGAPKQEKWINLHFREWVVPLAVGIGGTLDFLAGTQARAARWMQRTGLEWLGRLLSDPRRLARRYAANLGFLITAGARLLALRLSASGAARGCPTLDDSPELSLLPSLGAARARFAHLPDAPAASAFLREVAEAAERGSLVLELSGVGWLSSLELGALLAANRALRARHRRLLLVGACRRVRRLLEVCRLVRYLELCADLGTMLEILRRDTREARDGTVSLDPQGRMVLLLPAELTAANSAAYRERVAALRAQLREDGRAPTEIIVDASGLRFIDSAGAGLLVGTAKWARDGAVSMRAIGFGDTPRRILRVARLDWLLADPVALPGR